MPARTSKIVTAGASATALLSMVAAMGWQSGAGAANNPDPNLELVTTTPTLAPVVLVAPTTTLAPPITVAPTVATVPVAAVPVVTVPVVTRPVVSRPVVAPKPVVVPRAVPVVTLPVKKATKHQSNTTTRTSG